MHAEPAEGVLIPFNNPNILGSISPAVVISSTRCCFNTNRRSESWARGRILFLFRIRSSAVKGVFPHKMEWESVFSKGGGGSSLFNVYPGCRESSFRSRLACRDLKSYTRIFSMSNVVYGGGMQIKLGLQNRLPN